MCDLLPKLAAEFRDSLSFFFCESSREGTAASRKQWSPVCQLRCATNQGIRSLETFSHPPTVSIYHSHLKSILFLRRWLTSLQLWSKPSCQFQIILKITLASCPDWLLRALGGFPLAWHADRPAVSGQY